MKLGLVQSRSQAESYIKLGAVRVNGRIEQKAGTLVSENDKVSVAGEQYVSRAALKLASVTEQFHIDFRDKIVLDVGSSTGGFTDYALKHGAAKVIAVDVGTNQLHPSLHGDTRIELYEKTDIRDVVGAQGKSKKSPQVVVIHDKIDIVVADVSFISLQSILPSIKLLASDRTELYMMCKPQFEAGKQQVNKGIIKNSSVRRAILKDFEDWLRNSGFIILDKADSQVAGSKGNVERFYKLSIARG